MNQTQLKHIAAVEIEKEDFKNWAFESDISLNEENLKQNYQEYFGSVAFEEEGEPVSSVFVIYVYGNGTHQFEWS